MEEDKFSIEYIHRNLRWKYFSSVVSKYKTLNEYEGHEYPSILANGNESFTVVGIDRFKILLVRLDFGTSEQFYIMDDGNGKLRLSQFVRFLIDDQRHSEHRTGTGSDAQFESDREIIGNS